MRIQRHAWEKLPIRIDDINHDGCGVGHFIDDGDYPVVFVSGALPGEVVLAQGFSHKKNFIHARLKTLIKSSSHRVSPACPHFALCGGCALQHLDATTQVAYKQKGLVENLQRIGKVKPVLWATPIQSATWCYRRRARLSVKWVEKKGRVLVGFHEKSGRFIADIQTCLVLTPPFNHLIMPLAALIESLDIYRHVPQLEISVGDKSDGAPDPSLVIRHLAPFSPADCEKLRAFSQRHGIALYLQSSAQSIELFYPKAHRHYYHLPQWQLKLGFLPTDFIQVNRLGNLALVSRAMIWMDVKANDHIFDAFCGLGNFTLPLLKEKPGKVYGIEITESLIARARENLAINAITVPAQFLVDNLFEPSDATFAVMGSVNKVLLDPPRDGAEALCRLMPDNVSRIVYVSCHSASLARDLGILVHEKGFQLVNASVINLFPHTNHVESMVLLQR